jgi:hypothetical protein
VDDARDNGARDQPGVAGSDENFLSRWSRRKQADGKDETQSDPGPASRAAGMPPQEAAGNAYSRQELTDADMPPLDSLGSDSDFSLFMSPGVSEQLRTQALRKLFHLPDFNVTDGLNDYDEDYTQFAGLGKVVTREMQRMLKRELEAGIAPEAEPVVSTAAPSEPATGTETTADIEVDGDEDPSRLPGMS